MIRAVLILLVAIASGCSTPTPSTTQYPMGGGKLTDTNGVPVDVQIITR